jgi:hypothetical protein
MCKSAVLEKVLQCQSVALTLRNREHSIMCDLCALTKLLLPQPVKAWRSCVLTLLCCVHCLTCICVTTVLDSGEEAPLLKY